MSGIKPYQSRQKIDPLDKVMADSQTPGMSKPFAADHPMAWTQAYPTQAERESTYKAQVEKCSVQKQADALRCEARGNAASRERILNSDSIIGLDVYQGWKAKRLVMGASGDCGTNKAYDDCLERARHAKEAATSKANKYEY